jgi:glycosyltransferase involved in cell wall biosynthesis
MNLVHLLASPFVGGPERQVLGLARAQAERHQTTFLSFAERGLARPFLHQARAEGFPAHELQTNYPRLHAAITEVADWLRQLRAELLLTSGYKPDIIGWRAARAVGIPVVGIVHGWTGVTWKVWIYEWLDALALRFMDGVVCVSQATALRAQRRGIPASKIHVIRNALDPSPYDVPCTTARANVGRLFNPLPRFLVGTVGRLSPEKGMEVFVRAAILLAPRRADVGFVLMGEGPTRPLLERLIHDAGLGNRILLAGFCRDLPALLPGLDVFVSPSHTEGLPVALLEAMAARLPVVATAVGGTPEVVVDGQTGYLVPPNRPELLAERIETLLQDAELRQRMGAGGRNRVCEQFTFSAMASRYEELLAQLSIGTKAHKGVLHVGY